MSINPLDSAIEGLFDLGKTAIEKIWPDPIKRAEEMRKLQELKQDGDLRRLEAHVKIMLGQIETNLADAKSGSWFQAGWRPAIGWTGAITLAITYIPKAVVLTGLWTWQNALILMNAQDPSTVIITTFPDLGVTDVIGLLVSMLGVAGMRSFDKAKGIDTK